MRGIIAITASAIVSFACVQCSTAPPPPTSTVPPETATPTPRPSATRTPTSAPTPCGCEYVTKAGDTLWGMADRFGTTVQAIKECNGMRGDTIYAGTELRIPCEGGTGSPTQPPTPTHTPPPLSADDTPIVPTSTATPPPPATVVVNPTCSQFDAPGDGHYNLNQEYVCLTNEGGRPATMGGWKLQDEYGATYSFPDFILGASASVKVRTGCGQNSATDLYWCMNRAVWDNPRYGGDTVTVCDGQGNLVAKYTY
jgi:LysM repeat protein